MAESKAELESFLTKVKEERGKAGLKLNSKKNMASGLITLWQVHGGQWKQWQTLLSRAPKSLWMVTAVMKFKDCFLEEKLWQI